MKQKSKSITELKEFVSKNSITTIGETTIKTFKWFIKYIKTKILLFNSQFLLYFSKNPNSLRKS